MCQNVLCLGSQYANVFTIKENSISTTTHTPSTSYTLCNQPNQISSPFTRSQSFNNYSSYRNNFWNDRKISCNNTEYQNSKTVPSIDERYNCVQNCYGLDKNDSAFTLNQQTHTQTPSASTFCNGDNSSTR